MGIPALLVFTTVALLADNIEGGIDNGLLKCTGSTFYKVKKNGEASCRECPSCKGGGIGWDTTVNIKNTLSFCQVIFMSTNINPESIETSTAVSVLFKECICC